MPNHVLRNHDAVILLAIVYLEAKTHEAGQDGRGSSLRPHGGWFIALFLWPHDWKSVFIIDRVSSPYSASRSDSLLVFLRYEMRTCLLNKKLAKEKRACLNQTREIARTRGWNLYKETRYIPFHTERFNKHRVACIFAGA